MHGAPLLRARALIGLAHMYYFQGHAFDLPIGEALSAGRQAGDAWTVSFALFMQSLGALECGEHERAMARAIEAQEAADASGELVQQCGPLMILASIAIERGDQDEAHRLYEQSIAVARNTGDTWSLGILLALSAGLSILRGNVVEASARATEAMSLCQELEDPRGLAWSLEVFAGLMAARGYQDAARLWGAVDVLLDNVGGVLTPTIAWIRNRYYEPMKLSLGDTFEQARIEGRAMAPEQAIICARQHALLAGLG
jgi:non-specific serine/threonine protein kinase